MRTLVIGLFITLFTVLANSAKANTVLNFESLKVSQDNEKVELYIETFEQSSVCELKIKKLNITKPEDGTQSEILNLGHIEVTFEENFDQPCLKMIGPHRGKLVLTKGLQLPALAQGDQYIITINDFETAETLEVK